ncbi:hypothetical protein Tco_0373611, partial [Tanacetum coccineum]
MMILRKDLRKITRPKWLFTTLCLENTIITSLKALDEGYSSKNYVRKFLRAPHPKWRAKVTEVEESKDLTSLSLDEFIENFKAKKQSIDEERLPKVKMKNTPWRLETLRSSSREEEGQELKIFCRRFLEDKDETCLMAQASSE